jgi:hypothetical protein
MIPPGKAVFIPAGCSHSIRMWGTVAVRSICFPPLLKAAGLDFEDCRVLSLTPLLRELILRIVEWRVLDLRLPLHQSLLDVLLDEMNIAPIAPLMLPPPADPRALAVARHTREPHDGGDAGSTVAPLWSRAAYFGASV